VAIILEKKNDREELRRELTLSEVGGVESITEDAYLTL